VILAGEMAYGLWALGFELWALGSEEEEKEWQGKYLL